jgi:hypothetical protein
VLSRVFLILRRVGWGRCRVGMRTRYQIGVAALSVVSACQGRAGPTTPRVDVDTSISVSSPGVIPSLGRIEEVGCVFTASQELQLELTSTCATDPWLKIKVEDAAPSHHVLFSDQVNGPALTTAACCTCVGPLGTAPDGGVAALDVHVDGRCSQSKVAATSARFTCDVKVRGRTEPSCCSGLPNCSAVAKERDGG